MLLKTVHFGELDIQEESVFRFDGGILGFSTETKYVVVKNPEQGLPFDWLQAVENPELAFVITDPFFFKEDYEFDVSEAVQEALDVWDPSEVLVYSITVVTEDIRESTINLRAPLILNTRTKKGCQIILDNESYSVKHRIFSDSQQGV